MTFELKSMVMQHFTLFCTWVQYVKITLIQTIQPKKLYPKIQNVQPLS
jgi:hypothetical protein